MNANRRSPLLAVLFACAALSFPPITGAATPAPAEAGGKQRALVFEAENPLAVEAYLFTTAEVAYRVRNQSKRSIRILAIKPRRGGGQGVAEPETLAPGASGRVLLRRQVTELGVKQYGFRVRTDDAPDADYSLRAWIFGQSAYTPDLSGVDFKVVRKGHAARQRVTVASYETAKLELKSVLESPPWVKVSVAPPSASLSGQELVLDIALAADAPMGINKGSIHLLTTLASQPDLVLAVQAQVFDSVSVAPIPVTFQPGHVGEARESFIEYHSLDGKPLVLESVAESTGTLKLEPSPCGSRCVKVKLGFAYERPGEFGGAIRAKFKSHRDVLESGWDALVVGKDVKLHDLGVIGEEVDIASEPGVEP